MLYSIGLLYHILEEAEGSPVYRTGAYNVSSFMDSDTKTYDEESYKMEFCTVSLHVKLLEEYGLLSVKHIKVPDYPCYEYDIEEDSITEDGSKVLYALSRGLLNTEIEKYNVRPEAISKGVFSNLIDDTLNR